jgi:hypothetical protein
MFKATILPQFRVFESTIDKQATSITGEIGQLNGIFFLTPVKKR